jgi:hypothetical protein
MNKLVFLAVALLLVGGAVFAGMGWGAGKTVKTAVERFEPVALPVKRARKVEVAAPVAAIGSRGPET